MKRRRFLEVFGAAFPAVRIRLASLVPVSAAAREQPLRGEANDRSNASMRAEDAEADWVARSTGPGVLWAHDFRSDAEFHNFHKGVDAELGKTITSPIPSPFHASLVSTPFGGSRAIKSRALGTRITRDVPAARKHDIQVWYVEDISAIPASDKEYKLLVSNKELVTVLSRDVSAGTVTVRRGDIFSYPARTTTIGSGPKGRWIRPTAAIAAPGNGKVVDDVGITNGSARKARTWDPTNNNQHVNFREGYFGHRSYWDPAHGDALYKHWTPTVPPVVTHKDAWEGDEFYLQFRAKVSASRLNPANPSAKMLYIQNCTTSGCHQFFWGVGAKWPKAGVPEDWSYGPDYGEPLVALTCGGDSRARFGPTLTIPQGMSPSTTSFVWSDGTSETPWQQHPDDFPSATNKGGALPQYRAWCVPAEKWVTYLVHMKLGRDSAEVGAHATLTAPAQALISTDKSTEVLYLDDVSAFPDADGESGYPFYVQTRREKNGKPWFYEYMKVLSVGRAQRTLTVQRNYGRSGEARKNEEIGWDAGAVIAYGPYRFAHDPNTVYWSPDVDKDKRLGRRETTVEIFAAIEGEAQYRKIMSYDRFAWLFGDEFDYQKYKYNPPGVNSIELSQYINDYVGSGSVAPPAQSHDIQYTQVILSRKHISCPGTQA